MSRIAAGEPQARAILAASVAGLVVFVTYLPLVFLRYGLFDDYKKGGESLRELWRFDVSDGRPVGGVLYVLGFGFTRQISGFGVLRAVCILLLAVEAAGLAWLVATRTRHIWLGAAVAILANATVGAQIVAAWGATLFVAPVAAILGGWGGWILWEQRSVIRKGVLGCLLIVLALSTYQPAGMACIAVVVLLVITDERVGMELVRHIAITVLWLAAAFVVGLMVWKTCQLILPRTGGRGQLTSDIGSKWHWLTDVVIGRALRPFSLFLSSWLWGGVIGLLMLCAPMAPGTTIATWAIKIGVLAVGLIATYLPNLAVSESWASSRTLWIVMATVVSVAGIGLIRCISFVTRGGPRLMRPIAAVAVGAACVIAAVNATNNTIDYLGEPNSAELRAVQARMLRAVLQHPPMIVLKPSTWSDSLAPGVSFDEFGFPASAAKWAVLPMVLAVALDKGYTGAIEVSEDPSSVKKPPGTIVIDLGAVLRSINNRN